MCGKLLNKPELFEKYIKADFLSLAFDKVINVRLVIAKTIFDNYSLRPKDESLQTAQSETGTKDVFDDLHMNLVVKHL